ncbi:Protein of unknown function [Pyronema omphalodes CBS 100304]|uniref:Uncharacterized protein n=1 Tax=Pyronema omphalodes (strain CBS 100304) TaxID=1076935 RepID=U4LV69_PYROM|nr:Protein of unknown function [Pyronema omphalodes CBS 100304]
MLLPPCSIFITNQELLSSNSMQKQTQKQTTVTAKQL